MRKNTTTDDRQWFRIDIQDVSIRRIGNVGGVAFELFGLGASEAMDAGRFRSVFAYYVREDKLTDNERDLPQTFIR